MGTWVVTWVPSATGSFIWGDPPAMFHGNVDTLGFGDGHVESHRWLNGAIVTAGNTAARGGDVVNWVGPTSGSDYDYVFQCYRFPGWPQ